MVKKRGRIAKKPTIAPAADDWVTEGIDPDVESTDNNIIMEVKGTPDTMPLKDIQDRESNTRDLNLSHAESLMESIKAVGLIQPITVDRDGVLLAGGHRHLALIMLQNREPTAFTELFPDGDVPVRAMPFTASSHPDWALDVEVSENEVRRDYSREEVLAIAQRLRDAGYKDTPGKPKRGEKRLKPAIQTIIGKSMRTVERYLASDKNETPTNGEVRKNDISEADKHLQKAIAHLQKWESTHGKKRRETSLSKHIPDILERLQQGLE